MKTIVYQSYRTTGVPAWMQTCMRTVRSWAAANGYDYRFLGDELFDRVPDWFRAKAGTEICPVTDLARLVLAREFLAQGYERTVWVDADMLVFAPERLVVDIREGFAFCHERWLSVDADGQLKHSELVNNSITVFTRRDIHLEFFIDACRRIAQHKERLGKLDVGTAFLSHLRRALPFPLLVNVGMFSPVLMADICQDTDRYLRAYARHVAAPLACANLCASLLGSESSGVCLDDGVYESVVRKCLHSHGDLVNRFVAARHPAAGAGTPYRPDAP